MLQLDRWIEKHAQSGAENSISFSLKILQMLQCEVHTSPGGFFFFFAHDDSEGNSLGTERSALQPA